MVRQMNQQQYSGVVMRPRRDQSKDNKAVLVYEENTGDREPQKFYGKKDGFKSATGEVPNYAFMVFDVSDLG